MNSSTQKGFSLLEVLLAVTIAISLGSLQLSQMKRETENIQARAVGEQLKMVGTALNSYVALHYNQIVNMTDAAAPGTADDPGPRTCDTATNICRVTSDTLRRNGLLPNSFSGRNAYGATYEYYVRVSGSAPNWLVEGLVATSDPYVVGAVPRFDLIGIAMVTAGADSGTTRTVGNRMDGLNGAWQDSNYPVNNVGLLGYRVGYGTSGLSSYLRIDGSNYMTGNLHLGNPGDSTTFRSIDATRNITATGTVEGGKINVTSPTADAITTTAGTIGASGANMIIRAAGLQVMDAGGVTVAPIQAGNATFGSITSSGDGSFAGNLQGATLSTTTGGITSAGDITANTNIVAAGNFSTTNGNFVTTNGNISAGGNITSGTLNVANHSFTTNDWTMGTGANAGGWFMTDTTWMRVKNDKGILTNGEIRGGTVASNGIINAESYVQVGAHHTSGTACTDGVTPGGTRVPSKLARDNITGFLLECVGGVWKNVGGVAGNFVVNSASCSNGTRCTATCPAGTKLTGGGYIMLSPPVFGDPTGPVRSNGDIAGGSWIVDSVAGVATQYQANAICIN